MVDSGPISEPHAEQWVVADHLPGRVPIDQPALSMGYVNQCGQNRGFAGRQMIRRDIF